jgi:hypothetical protein
MLSVENAQQFRFVFIALHAKLPIKNCSILMDVKFVVNVTTIIIIIAALLQKNCMCVISKTRATAHAQYITPMPQSFTSPPRFHRHELSSSPHPSRVLGEMRHTLAAQITSQNAPWSHFQTHPTSSPQKQLFLPQLTERQSGNRDAMICMGGENKTQMRIKARYNYCYDYC